MRFFILLLFYCLSCVLGASGNTNGGTIGEFDRDKALAISQAVIGSEVGDYEFIDGQGNPVRLSKFRGKPLVISLIYTSCFHICPMTTRHLSTVVDKARDVLGEESFHVLTIGFDSKNDTADAMRIFARQQSVNENGWNFLSTQAEIITNLIKDLGFIFFPSPHGFDHLVQATILDAQGKVYRQVYGIKFNTPQLVEPLKELVFGQPQQASLLDSISSKIKLFCTVYDPASDRYHFDYSIFMGLLVGLLMGGSMVVWVIKEWRKYLRESNQ